MTKKDSLEHGNKDYLLQYLSEKERQQIAKRTAYGLKRAREQGRLTLGRVPFGYHYSDGTLLIDAQESEVVEKYFII